jgi:predicted small lipoprotein YifL
MRRRFTSPPRRRGARIHTLDSRLHGNDGWKKRAIIVGVMLAAISLAGCGKKGPPQPPPGVPNTYPQNYPAQ